jgi:hypothetical protein
VITHHISGIEQDLTDFPVADPGNPITFAWPYEHEKVRVAVSATVDAGPPDLVADRLNVPDALRCMAESAIAEYADVLAIAHQCKRAIRSPQPAVALVPCSDDEHDTALGVVGLHHPGGGSTMARVMPPVVPGELAQAAFADRLDGLAMLADSLSENTAIARARELFRLFERAFRRGPSGCVAPLTTFLSTAPRHDASQYALGEVRHWLQQLRPEATHGDRRDSYARSADVAPYLSRMEYAAYDVLLNKATWRHSSATRRHGLYFMSAPGPQGAIQLLRASATVTVDWLDPFGVHAIDFESRLQLPDDWVWRMPGQEPERPNT